MLITLVVASGSKGNNMIKITLKGGLGNQMFQYAYGRNLSIMRNTELKLDLTHLIYPDKIDTLREFKLNAFDICANIYKPIKRPLLKIFFSKIINKVLKKEQFFQSEKYFKNNENTIRKEIVLKKPLSTYSLEILNLILSKNNPVSLHIRRGDYVSNAKTNIHHGLCPIEYYEKSIEYIKLKINSPTFFIFSDDIHWAKDNLKSTSEMIFVSKPEIPDYEELILMSKCSHHIIANSSFSWWGAWLNPNPSKIVVAPKKWLNNVNIDTTDICPSEWIRIQP